MATALHDLGEPNHTCVPCWMPKPFTPRNKCIGCFAPTRNLAHMQCGKNDLCYLKLVALLCVIPRIWHALAMGVGLLQFHVAGLGENKRNLLSKTFNNL